ncbi:MAG: hypothetical protein ACJ76I_01105 [Gaiellaceae bacterium]
MRNERIVNSAAYLTWVLALVCALASGCGGQSRFASGSVDTSFGTRGVTRVSLGFAPPGHHSALVRESDGGLVVAGSACPTPDIRCGTAVVARFDGNGSLDRHFGSAGRAYVHVGRDAYISGMAVERGGRIVLAGSSTRPGSYRRRFILVGLRANGSVDRSFGVAGRAMTQLGWHSVINAFSLTAGGQFVVAGTILDRRLTRAQIALARYSADGRVDPTFGQQGTVTTSLGAGAGTKALTITPNGQLIVAAERVLSNRNHAFALVRYRANGQRDPRFGNRGVVVGALRAFSYPAALIQQGAGRVVMIGVTESGAGRPRLMTRRYNAVGRLDTNFPARSVVNITGAHDLEVDAATSTNSRNYAVAGTATSADGRVEWIVLWRFRSNGSPDPSFGEAGVVQLPVPVGTSVYNLVSQPNGALLLASVESTRTGPALTLRRFRP